jgi:hypothetical protein
MHESFQNVCDLIELLPSLPDVKGGELRCCSKVGGFVKLRILKVDTDRQNEDPSVWRGGSYGAWPRKPENGDYPRRTRRKSKFRVLRGQMIFQHEFSGAETRD